MRLCNLTPTPFIPNNETAPYFHKDIRPPHKWIKNTEQVNTIMYFHAHLPNTVKWLCLENPGFHLWTYRTMEHLSAAQVWSHSWFGSVAYQAFKDTLFRKTPELLHFTSFIRSFDIIFYLINYFLSDIYCGQLCWWTYFYRNYDFTPRPSKHKTVHEFITHTGKLSSKGKIHWLNLQIHRKFNMKALDYKSDSGY